MISNWHNDEKPSQSPSLLPAYSGESATWGEVLGKSLPRGVTSLTKGAILIDTPFLPSEDEIGPGFDTKENAFRAIDTISAFEREHLTVTSKGYSTAKQIVGGVAMLPGMLLGGVAGLLAGATTPGIDLIDQGVDPTTATQATLLNLAGTAAAVGLPAAGKTLAQTVGLVGAGVVMGAGQDAAVSELLKARDYDEQSEMFDPFNPVARIMDLGVGGAFGYLNLRGIKKEQAARDSLRQAELDAVDTVAQVKQARASAPNLAGDALHGQAVTTAAEAISSGAAVKVDAPPAAPRYGLASFYDDLIAAEKYGLSEEQADTVLTKVALFAITRGEDPEAWVGRAIKGVEGQGSRPETLPHLAEIDTTLTPAGTSFEADGRAILQTLRQPDISTVINGLGHVFRRHLSKGEQYAIDSWLLSKNPGSKWNVADEERFARAFERYVYDGEAPTAELAGPFAKLKGWMLAIYQNLAGSPLKESLSPQVRKVFDRMFIVDNMRVQVQQGKLLREALGDPAAEILAAQHLILGEEPDLEPTISVSPPKRPAPLNLPEAPDSVSAFLENPARIGAPLKELLEIEASRIADSNADKFVVDGFQKAASFSDAPQWYLELQRALEASNNRMDKASITNALKKTAAGGFAKLTPGQQQAVLAGLDALARESSAAAHAIDPRTLQVGDRVTLPDLSTRTVIKGEKNELWLDNGQRLKNGEALSILGDVDPSFRHLATISDNPLDYRAESHLAELPDLDYVSHTETDGTEVRKRWRDTIDQAKTDVARERSRAGIYQRAAFCLGLGA